MAITATTIKSLVTDGNRRVITYECTDSTGAKHLYGPVNTMDAAFDAEAHKAIVADKVGTALADAEADAVLGED